MEYDPWFVDTIVLPRIVIHVRFVRNTQMNCNWSQPGGHWQSILQTRIQQMTKRYHWVGANLESALCMECNIACFWLGRIVLYFSIYHSHSGLLRWHDGFIAYPAILKNMGEHVPRILVSRPQYECDSAIQNCRCQAIFWTNAVIF